MTEHSFTGSLSKDSPALWNRCKLLGFSKTEMEELSSLYKMTYFRKNLEHPLVERVSGSRFNPRPARIATILLTDYRKVDFQLIRSLFQSLAESSAEQPDIVALPASNDIRAIFCATLLDRVRHIHLEKRENSEKEAILTQARDQLNSLENNSELAMMITRIKDSIEKQQRLID